MKCEVIVFSLLLIAISIICSCIFMPDHIVSGKEDIMESTSERFTSDSKAASKNTVSFALRDFDSLVIDESTDSDLYAITHSLYMAATSYGGLCSFPLEDGNFIVVKLCYNLEKKELVVHNITVSEKDPFEDAVFYAD